MHKCQISERNLTAIWEKTIHPLSFFFFFFFTDCQFLETIYFILNNLEHMGSTVYVWLDWNDLFFVKCVEMTGDELVLCK